eukprot:UN06674
MNLSSEQRKTTAKNTSTILKSKVYYAGVNRIDLNDEVAFSVSKTEIIKHNESLDNIQVKHTPKPTIIELTKETPLESLRRITHLYCNVACLVSEDPLTVGGHYKET